ncbi:MAG: hypothetical protein KF819_34585 [Labilithrix sp.]|nr:hypothetical protein [Labilithrix sp.]
MSDNPFERYDLDPQDGIEKITRRLKELAEEATDERERDRIRAAWEELTLHPARRLRAARSAHPETRRPLGDPPLGARLRVTATELTLDDLAARPSVLAALASGEPTSEREERDAIAPPLDDDPHF